MNFNFNTLLTRNIIKYPIATSNVSGQLVNICDARNYDKSELTCPQCKNSFVAVINHKSPHFKHKPNSKCNGGFETYLHWLAKEVFKLINEIELPEISVNDLTPEQRQKFQGKINAQIDKEVPETYRLKFKKGLKKNLVDAETFVIDKVEIEKSYKTSLGEVRVDVVATIKNKEVFIEPFVTNSIDEFKKKKLNLINNPTLSIDLMDLYIMFEYDFTVQN